MYVVTASHGPDKWAKHYAHTLDEACWAVVKRLPATMLVSEALETIGQIDEDGGLVGPFEDGTVVEVKRSGTGS